MNEQKIFVRVWAFNFFFLVRSSVVSTRVYFTMTGKWGKINGKIFRTQMKNEMKEHLTFFPWKGEKYDFQWGGGGYMIFDVKYRP